MRETDVQLFASTASKINAEDAKARAVEFQKKVAEQLRWKEAWDTESHIRQLKMSVEQGMKPLELRQFNAPIESSSPPAEKPALLPIVAKKSRTPLSHRRKSHSGAGVFITDEAEISSKAGADEAPKYPWERRERSREQYRTIANQ